MTKRDKQIISRFFVLVIKILVVNNGNDRSLSTWTPIKKILDDLQNDLCKWIEE